MGSQGQSPRQGLGAVAPRSAPAWMPGVYAKGLCKDAKPTKHIQPFTGERGLGIGIVSQKFVSKTDFFFKLT